MARSGTTRCQRPDCDPTDAWAEEAPYDHERQDAIVPGNSADLDLLKLDRPLAFTSKMAASAPFIGSMTGSPTRLPPMPRATFCSRWRKSSTSKTRPKAPERRFRRSRGSPADRPSGRITSRSRRLYWALEFYSSKASAASFGAPRNSVVAAQMPAKIGRFWRAMSAESYWPGGGHPIPDRLPVPAISVHHHHHDLGRRHAATGNEWSAARAA